MNGRIAILPGDGIGPEVIDQAVKALKAIESAFEHHFTLDYGLIGASAIDKSGDPYPRETETLCNYADAILFGAIGNPRYDNDPSARVRPEYGLLKMRKSLDLFANIRPVRSYDALLHRSPLKEKNIAGVDFVVYRELTGGIYFGEPRGRSEDASTAFDTCVYSVKEIRRIAELAFKAAEGRRNKLTLVDKANVLATSRLWRETVKSMAGNYPGVDLDFLFVDNAAMQLIQNPGRFDVILTENMFGDILTDEASAITGSMGMLPSASLGEKLALYEPVHGSYPEVAGQDKANPMAAILSLAMMLEYSLGLRKESLTIRHAVENAITQDYVTEDIAGNAPKTTSQVGDYIARQIQEKTFVNET